MITQQHRDAKKLATAQFLMRLPSVHAVGIGNKEIDGEDSGILCVRVYLNKKETSSFTITSKIPPEILGIPTDVIALEDRLFNPLSRIEVGTEGRPNLPFLKGSFGAVVSLPGKSGSGKKTENYLLGVNHVLSLNGLVPAELPIRSNGAVIGSTLGGRFVELRESKQNLADCALASFTGDPSLVPMVIRNLDHVVDPALGMPVKKVGAASDPDAAVDGTIVDVSLDFVAHYSFGSFLLEDQILIKLKEREEDEDDCEDDGEDDNKGAKGFAEQGDSGAIVAQDTLEGNAAVGIVVASAGKFTAASPMKAVLKGLGLHMLVQRAPDRMQELETLLAKAKEALAAVQSTISG